MSEQTQPDRGSRTTPRPQQPTPPTGGEEMQDQAPPRDVSSAELVGEGSGQEPAADAPGTAEESLASDADVALSEDVTKDQATRRTEESRDDDGPG